MPRDIKARYNHNLCVGITLRRCQESFRWGWGEGVNPSSKSQTPHAYGSKIYEIPHFYGSKISKTLALSWASGLQATDFITAGIAEQLTPRMCIDRRANVHSANVGSMLGQHRRHWANIKTAMYRSH